MNERASGGRSAGPSDFFGLNFIQPFRKTELKNTSVTKFSQINHSTRAVWLFNRLKLRIITYLNSGYVFLKKTFRID